MTQLFRLVFASGALLAAKSALLGMRTLVLLIIAAHGGSGGLAIASFALSLAEAGRWVADFGTDTWNVRAIAIARDARGESRILTAALLVKAIGSVLVGLTIFVVCWLAIPINGIAYGCLAALLLMTSQVAGLTIAYFQTKDDIPKLTPMLIPCGGTVLAAFLSLTWSGSVLTALAAMTAGEIISAVLLVLLLQKRVALKDWSSAMPDAALMARSCVPTAAFGIIVGVYSRLDTFTLAKFSFAALAVYTVAQRLFQPFQIAVTSFGSIISSRTALLHAEGRPVAEQLLRREMPLIIGCSLVSSVVLFFGGRLLVEQVFPMYRTALGPLTLLCVVLPFLAFNSAMAGLLLGYGRYWAVLAVSVIDLALTYLCMIVLIPLYGSTGTALSLLIGALINGAALSLAAVFATRSPAAGTNPVGISAQR
jgi:O-antigen/teichoic acid export membrane protein